MREICLDTETTGFEPRDGHRIVEIGCVEMIDKIPTGNSYHTYINPERDMPEGAFKVHGLSEEFLKDKPKFAEIADEFVKFVAGANLVIHNAAFDMKFINHELRLCDLEIIERKWAIDSLQIARQKFPGAGNTLDALCKRFGIDTSRRVKHGALLDAELLADVYLELMGGSQSSMFDAEDQKKKEQAINDSANIKKRPTLESRNFKLSENEITAHKEFITNNFKENLWDYSG